MQTDPASELFAAHIQTLQSRMEESLALLGKAGIAVEAVLIHSGSERMQWYDDWALPFRPYGHFTHWLPVDRPDQMLLIRPGSKPTWYRLVRKDFWYDPSIPIDGWCAAAFDIVDVSKPEQTLDLLPPSRRMAFCGENTEFAASLGIPSGLINEKNLLNRMDWGRSLKTPYEIERTRQANVLALKGHEAARQRFLDDGSEFDIYNAYLDGCQAGEADMPFHAIVGHDEKAAILHYQNRRKIPGKSSRLVLVDAGYRHYGYASDITRTWTRDTTHPVMRRLIQHVKTITAELSGLCEVGKPYSRLHESAHEKVLDALMETGVVRGHREKLVEQKVSALFMPHGIGHMLGVQVHDVGGLFKDASGALVAPPAEHKNLRMTRQLQDTMIYTIEPGIYFMPILLEAERASERGKMIHWDLVDELIPLGGVRWEDDILITPQGPVNLTAPDAIILPEPATA